MKTARQSIDLDRGTWLTPTRFAEVGSPTGLFRDPQARWVALASDFDAYAWPGRVLSGGQLLRRRLSLYSADLAARLGVFGEARFPINAVAFHPAEPVLAIGTGSYDGGHFFEGELFYWNWETSEVRRLLDESREVVACRFDERGGLVVLMRPRDEEEFADADAFNSYVTTTLPDTRDVADRLPVGGADPLLQDLEPVSPVDAGFEAPDHINAQARTAARDFERNAGFRPRHRVADLAWTDNRELAAVHDTCLVELWSAGGELLREISDEARGVQLLRWGDQLVVSALPRGTKETPAASRLHSLDGALVRQFDRVYLFSSDSGGRLLCRDVSRPSPPAARQDLAWTATRTRCYAPTSDITTPIITTCESTGTKRSGSCAAVRRRATNTSCCVGSGQTSRSRSRCPGIRRETTSARQRRCSCEAPSYALADGSFGLLDLERGAVIHETKATYQGLPTVVQCLSVGAAGLAVGTLCGNICVLPWG